MSSHSALPTISSIALVAHDHKKKDLIDWVMANREELSKHKLFATGTTGALIERETGLSVFCYQSGPLGGDLQIGAKISENQIDFLIFFWDPLMAQPHDPDVKALLRVAVVWNIPFACNRATADYLISSRHITDGYHRDLPDYTPHRHRDLDDLPPVL